MLAVECPWSLKEWAVTIEALDRGEQILLVRKGGIREKEFKVEHEEFFLYPSFEHQKPELLKPQYQGELQQVLANWDRDTSKVPLTHWCQVTEVIEVMDPATVEALSPLGGVRIEDDVVVRAEGVRNLTREQLPVGGGILK